MIIMICADFCFWFLISVNHDNQHFTQMFRGAKHLREISAFYQVFIFENSLILSILIRVNHDNQHFTQMFRGAKHLREISAFYQVSMRFNHLFAFHSLLLHPFNLMMFKQII
ncbi:MAG: hypothetical protein DRR00_13765 [Candidatus Parabeggiatoa sp. nov. 3]|nr:MAG: hypothetical protein DRR00_13765 [Gammaproteobacteria bacterium]